MSMPTMQMSTELSRRVATGVIGGLALLLLIIFGGRVGVSLLAVVLSLGMLYEYVEIVIGLPDKAEKRLVLLGSTWLIAFVNFWVPRAEYELLILTFVGLFSYFLFTADRHSGQDFQTHFRELVYSIFGMVYLSFLPLFFPLLHDASSGVHWTIVFLLVVWSGDTGAYFVGKKYGKRKLYALISPKKTWEGAAGGLAAGFVVTLLYKLIFFRHMSWLNVFAVPVLVGSVSQVGDLCESFLKRAFDKKDSGTILPGHGGFLDRFDGVLFGLPIMYGCIRIFG